MSWEHVPPEAASNNQRIKLADINQLLNNPDWNDFENPRGGTYQQRGAGGFTLCGRCNNQTGHWYGPHYVSWAYQGMRHLLGVGEGSSLRLPFFITPLRVIKQIMCLFASACGPEFFEVNTDLRRWVLNPSLTGLRRDIRIYCYFVSSASRGTRQSGITGLLQLGKGTSAFAEIAYPPFGYLLTLDSRPLDPALADLSFFSSYGPKEFGDCFIQLPVRQVNSYFPGDFRTLAEIKEQFLDSKAAELAALGES